MKGKVEAMEDLEMEKVSGGVNAQYENYCPKCHCVAYVLILVESGNVEHRRCNQCHTEYWYQR